MTDVRRLLGMVLPLTGVLGSASVLAVLAPPRLPTLGAGPQAAAGLLSATVDLVAWAALAWLALILACRVGAALPGAAGRLATLGYRRLTPGLVKRALVGTMAVTVAGAGVGTSAAAAPQRPPPARAALALGLLASGGPIPDWPASPAAPESTGPPDELVVVRPGDSLWTLTAQRLGSQATDSRVARCWPAYWADNRAVIGPDPDLILPGERLRLRPPAFTCPTEEP